MNDDERIQHYFRERAPELDLPAAGAPAVMARGRRRRHRRAVMKVGGVAAALAIGGMAAAQAFDGRGDHHQVAANATVVTPSPLHWSTVSPTRGLSHGQQSATFGGATYNVSSAPGSTDPTSGSEKYLYRSTDGADWDPVTLPGGVQPRSLTAGGDRLYAVGTAPAGGGGNGERVSVASLADGTDAWTAADLPLDLASLGRAAGSEVRVEHVDAAVVGGTAVVAVEVRAQADVAALFPRDGIFRALQQVTPSGVETIRIDGTEQLCVGGSTTTTAADGEPSPPTTPGVEVDPCGPAPTPGEKEFFTWAELGLSPEAGQLAAGRRLLFTSVDGAAFTAPATPPPTQADDRSPVSGTGDLVAAADGFWYFFTYSVGDGPYDRRTQGVFSADGITWAQTAAFTAAGAIEASGTLDGDAQLALATSGGEGKAGILTLWSVTPTGARSVDTSTVFGDDERVGLIGYGPMGVAMVAYGADPAHPEAWRVVHSRDLVTFSSVDGPAPAPGTRGQPAGLSVTADAITVRSYVVTGPTPSLSGPVPVRLFVGTPD